MALADLDAEIDHSFGKPTKYELVHDSKCYAPKAIIGIAFRHLTGEILHHGKFSGGNAPGQANYELCRLKFDVQGKAEKPRMVPLWRDAGTLPDLSEWKAKRFQQGVPEIDPFVTSLRPGDVKELYSPATLSESDAARPTKSSE